MALTQVKTAGIAADAVTGAKIADDQINSEHYVDGSIDNAHVADDQINSEHYAAASIDHEHLADDAVDADILADNSVGLAAMAHGTDGNLITYNASGEPAHVATGNDGQVLTSAGAGAAPTFEDISGAKIIQIVCSPTNDGGSTNSTSFVDGGGNVQITPTSSSNKVMVIHTTQFGARSQGDHNDADIRYRWTRTVDGTETEVYAGLCRPQGAADVDNIALYITVTTVYRDHPNTTNEVDYQMQHRITGSSSHMHSYLNNHGSEACVYAIEYEEVS